MTTETGDLQEVLYLAEGAYMAEDYGEGAWRIVTKFLLGQGHSAVEAAAIMLSKHARWADDSEGRGAGRTTSGAAFRRYYNHMAEAPGFNWRTEASELVRETWPRASSLESLEQRR
jgi:hypothetical protein